MNVGAVSLGIDIGTSKVAAVLINDQAEPLASCSRPHHADRKAPPGHDEQDAATLLNTTRAVVRELPSSYRRNVASIGVTGQMHGVLVCDSRLRPQTPLFTWRDKRCLSENFLAELRERSGIALNCGFGCATLAWLVSRKAWPSGARHASTIQDLLVARLCNLTAPVIDPTNAASWGLFNLEKNQWDTDALRAVGLESDWMPHVLPCGAKAGDLCSEWAAALEVPPKTPVTVAIGDNQASIMATVKEPEHELALTLGTGGQLSAVVPRAECEAMNDEARYELRPFPGDRFLVVASSLCGGSAWNWLAETVEKWMGDLDVDPPSRDAIFERLNHLGAHAAGGLTIVPQFLGERYDESLRGSISGIDLQNFDLGRISRGLARGIIANLAGMFPASTLRDRTGIVGSGNALRRNHLLREMAVEVLGLPIRICDRREEAACGAALLAAHRR